MCDAVSSWDAVLVLLAGSTSGGVSGYSTESVSGWYWITVGARLPCSGWYRAETPSQYFAAAERDRLYSCTISRNQLGKRLLNFSSRITRLPKGWEQVAGKLD